MPDGIGNLTEFLFNGVKREGSTVRCNEIHRITAGPSVLTSPESGFQVSHRVDFPVSQAVVLTENFLRVGPLRANSPPEAAIEHAQSTLCLRQIAAVSVDSHR